MAWLRRQGWSIGLAAGLVLGLILAGVWPHTPLGAVATDRTETFAIATGPVDEEVEAIYFLDFLTGVLSAAVVSNQSPGFQATFQANVNRDLAGFVQTRNAGLAKLNAARSKKGLPPLPQLQFPQSPNFMMVTGLIDIRRGAAARTRPSLAAVYVAETNTGILLAYVVPWNQSAHAGNQPFSAPLTLWAADQFTPVLVQTP